MKRVFYVLVVLVAVVALIGCDKDRTDEMINDYTEFMYSYHIVPEFSQIIGDLYGSLASNQGDGKPIDLSKLDAEGIEIVSNQLKWVLWGCERDETLDSDYGIVVEKATGKILATYISDDLGEGLTHCNDSYFAEGVVITATMKKKGSSEIIKKEYRFSYDMKADYIVDSSHLVESGAWECKSMVFANTPYKNISYKVIDSDGVLVQMEYARCDGKDVRLDLVNSTAVIQ